MHKIYTSVANYFTDLGCSRGPYTSTNLIKKRIFFNRLNNPLSLIPSDIGREDKVVDFGCGEGVFMLLLAHEGYKNIVGVDYNEATIKFAKKMYNAGLIESDKTISYTFAESINDVSDISLLCAIDVFEHFTADQLQIFFEENSIEHIVINLPSENLLYNLGTRFVKEADHKMRWYEVIDVLTKKSGYVIQKKKNFFGLFYSFYLKKESF